MVGRWRQIWRAKIFLIGKGFLTIRVKGVYENGVIRPEHPVSGLEEHEHVHVTIERDRDVSASPDQILELCAASLHDLDSRQLEIVEGARLRRLRNTE